MLLRADTDGGMNRGIYATASGMQGAQQLLDVITNNLANASTIGYKKDGLAFDDTLARELRADGGNGPVIGTLGQGPQEKGRYVDLSSGQLATTGNPLDLAITESKGFFAIQGAEGTTYTRNGSFSLNAERELVTQQGKRVLDEQNTPITVPEGRLEVSADGTIQVDGVPQGKVGVFSGAFKKISGSEFSCDDAVPIDDFQIRTGALESSNVNPIETMVGMISLNRSFELAQRSIIQQDELTEKLIQSLNQQ